MDAIVTAMTTAFGTATEKQDGEPSVALDAFTADATGLSALDAHLATRATIRGYALSADDASVYVRCVGAIKASKEALTYARRWASYASAKGSAATSGAEAYAVETSAVPVFERPVVKDKADGGVSTSGQEGAVAAAGAGGGKKEKKGGKGPPVAKDVCKDVSALDIRVGVIEKAWEHPGAEKLWCEMINLGEKGTRQICSGLRAFKTLDQMVGARVLVICNVKPGKLRDIVSDGLVLCTSNADHTEVDFVIPPEGAAVGERVMFAGFEGEPEDVLNPKKKQLEAVSPDLKTNAEGIACYKDVPFMTSSGPCTSSLKDCLIK